MIRELTLPELPDVVATAGPAFFTEGRLPGRYNAASYLHFWRGLLTSGRGVIFQLSTSAGEAMGWIGGMLFDDPLTGDLVVMESFWFAYPKHRGLGAIKLIKRLEQWARDHRAVRLVMACLNAINFEIMGDLYTRAGFQPTETFYLKELK